jgi:hypothetical protein
MIHAGHRPLGQNKFQEAWRSDNDDILATLIYVHTLSPSSRRSGLTSTTKKRCRAALMQQHPHKTPTPLRTTSSDDYIPPFDGIYNTHNNTHTISLTHTHTHTHTNTHTHIQVHHQKEEPGHVEATPINTNPHTRIRESTMNLVTDKKTRPRTCTYMALKLCLKKNKIATMRHVEK